MLVQLTGATEASRPSWERWSIVLFGEIEDFGFAHGLQRAADVIGGNRETDLITLRYLE